MLYIYVTFPQKNTQQHLRVCWFRVLPAVKLVNLRHVAKQKVFLTAQS